MATTGTSSPMREVRPFICPITGSITYLHQITEAAKTDRVRMCMKDVYTLPVIFVPGIMGSNLKETVKGKPVWRLDGEAGMLGSHATQGAGLRQIALHPNRTTVDNRGEVPENPVGSVSTPEQFTARGWGEVGATSYKEFLIWLEDNLNGGGTQSKHAALNKTLAQVQDGRKQWGAKKEFKGLHAEDSENAQQWFYPVHAFGYNWLDDNKEAAKELAKRIQTTIDFYKQNGLCEQVILVTHSMGGLVARACSMLPGMDKKIAGVVHGVMPAVGAAVAYRRCKVGMMDEGASGLNKAGAEAWGAAKVIGSTGKEVTAVFAQAPGALQLLPTKQYPLPQWLQIVDAHGGPLPEQPKTDDPYEGVYKEQKKWWGLIREEWLKPPGGQKIDWVTYLKALDKAFKFHESIQDHYHPNTWGFYGTGVNSFEGITWKLETGDAPLAQTPSASEVYSMEHEKVPLHGSNPEHIAGPPKVLPTPRGPVVVESASTWLRLNSAQDLGDGTVPSASGAYPADPTRSANVQQCVKQFFEVSGIEHEPAYQKLIPQHITAYAIAKIAAALPLPKRA